MRDALIEYSRTINKLMENQLMLKLKTGLYMQNNRRTFIKELSVSKCCNSITYNILTANSYSDDDRAKVFFNNFAYK